MIRGSPAVWIWPKLALFSAVIGALKFTWLITLKTSHRNWTTVLPDLERAGQREIVLEVAGFTTVNGASVL